MPTGPPCPGSGRRNTGHESHRRYEPTPGNTPSLTLTGRYRLPVRRRSVRAPRRREAGPASTEADEGGDASAPDPSIGFVGTVSWSANWLICNQFADEETVPSRSSAWRAGLGFHELLEPRADPRPHGPRCAERRSAAFGSAIEPAVLDTDRRDCSGHDQTRPSAFGAVLAYSNGRMILGTHRLGARVDGAGVAPAWRRRTGLSGRRGPVRRARQVARRGSESDKAAVAPEVGIGERGPGEARLRGAEGAHRAGGSDGCPTARTQNLRRVGSVPALDPAESAWMTKAAARLRRRS